MPQSPKGYSLVSTGTLQNDGPDSPTSNVEKKPPTKHAVIIVCAVLMNGTTLFMAEAMQGMNDDYNNTLVITSIVAVSYTYCLLIWLGWMVLRKKQWASCLVTQDAGDHPDEGHFSWGYYFKIAFPISILSITCRASWYFSLGQTNAAANNAIYQSTTAWVYVFSMVLLKEKFDFIKFSSLIVGVGGTVMVALSEADSSESGVDQNMIGYVDLIASVLTYSLFQVFTKRFAAHVDDPHPQMNSLRFCGVLGVWCCVWGPCAVAFVHVTGIRPFELPPSHVTFLAFSNGLMDAIFTASLLILLRLTDPTFASMCSILVVPMTIIADKIIHNYTAPFLTYIAMVIILGAVTAFNYRVYRLRKASELEDGDDEERTGLLNGDRKDEVESE